MDIQQKASTEIFLAKAYNLWCLILLCLMYYTNAYIILFNSILTFMIILCWKIFLETNIFFIKAFLQLRNEWNAWDESLYLFLNFMMYNWLQLPVFYNPRNKELNRINFFFNFQASKSFDFFMAFKDFKKNFFKWIILITTHNSNGWVHNSFHNEKISPMSEEYKNSLSS